MGALYCGFEHYLEYARKCDQIGFLPLIQFQLLNQVEEFRHIFERQHLPVVQIRRRLFYAAIDLT